MVFDEHWSALSQGTIQRNFRNVKQQEQPSDLQGRGTGTEGQVSAGRPLTG
jgi:hypothetical protein